MIKMRDKGICKVLAFLMVLVMIGSCVAVPSAGDISESDRNSSSATIYVPDDYPTIQKAVDAVSPGDTIIVRGGTYKENVLLDKKLTLIQLYVNESGWWRAGAVFNASATPIQHAIDNATDGDSIFVWNGTYKENVTVNKHLTLEGEGMDVVRVEAVSSKGHVFEVTADCVHISGFTVTGATGSGKAGIYLRSDHCCISDNNASNNYYGIRLQDSSNNTLTNNTAKSNSEDGIYLDSSSHNKLTNNTANSNNWYGIHMAFSSNNTLANNTAKMNMLGGVWLSFSSNNTLTNNTANLNDGWGIFLLGSSTDMFFTSNNNTLTSNTANSNNWSGIYLHYSCDNTLKNNTMSGNSYNFAVFGADLSHYIQYIDTSNHVDGKPVYYWVNQKDKHMPNDAGFVGIVNSTNITVRDLRLRNNSAGVLFAYTNNSRIENISVSNNGWGIRLRYSNDNMLKNSTAYSNNCGICMFFSSNNTLTNNIMSRNIRNFAVFGDALHHYIQNMDTSNFVDGKPIYYWFDQQNKQVSSDAGYVGIVNSTNITVRDLTLTNNSGEVLFAYTNNSVIDNASNNCVIRLYSSSNNTLTNNMGDIHLRNSSSNILTNNNASKNFFGIYLWNSSNNTLTDNIVNSNSVYGIYLDSSSRNNKIYLNNFINNTDNVYTSGLNNIWNSTSKITYIYNETTYTNYLGNYWSDYTGTDAEGDGIGDTPYVINSDKDNYPLMQPFENYFPDENKTTENKNPKLAFSSYYHPINISVNLSVPPYPLPLNLSNITNIENITAVFGFSEREKELLRNNGFVIIDYGRRDDIIAPYKNMKMRGIPIFVTTDTLLHLYHIQFNEILKGIEEREFFDELVDMSNAMLEQSIQDHENFVDPEMKEAARRNVAYFAVALKLLQTPTEGYNGSEDIKEVNFTIPDYVKGEVEEEIENIEEHEGSHPSVIFNSDPNCICDYPCCYCEDYSQYVPRGHYTRSEKLKRYFNAMMWYGRMAFLLKGGDDALISEQDAKISTIQAALISSELPDVNVGNKTAQETWDRIYSVTAFFVGTADDLTPYEYRDALSNVFGAEYNVSELSTEDKLLKLKVELARLRSPEIYGGSGVCVVYPPITKEKLYDCLAKTKGMRFMGQRFVPDSYMFDQLVSPAVGVYIGNDTPFTMCITDAGRARCFPRGLDIMAVLGSERAEDILIEEGDTEYAGIDTSYNEQLEEFKSQFAGFDVTEWNRNLYWSWLYTLKPLLKQFGDGYPTFMQTKAWQEKELQTSLASWTELRHDTILYAKQSYTPPLLSMPPQPKPVRGYVEPVPEFYARLWALTKMTENGLVDLAVLSESEKARLQRLERILERLINISKAELENRELTEDDYEFIRNFGENLDYVVAGVDVEGKETTIVADVHTDCNTEMVLEEGVGYVNLILVAYNVPDGKIIIGAGPVFSYYEFKQPVDDRLTDEKWKEMLRSNPPERPGWVEGIGGDR